MVKAGYLEQVLRIGGGNRDNTDWVFPLRIAGGSKMRPPLLAKRVPPFLMGSCLLDGLGYILIW